ncbi:hypothetical protein CALVIDRAFT_218745 [Calocera viscosa TUFC12733]|uniref:Uncharacterized protein n=1 Tax=Calocera viscosa (strain TUFC12733) TaxID=1330018 RepID=A0A167RIQ7_CALVF|nr:hypothetical protein CALVIDRAFT_218745 [Calocera viscosa TUFC12733]
MRMVLSQRARNSRSRYAVRTHKDFGPPPQECPRPACGSREAVPCTRGRKVPLSCNPDRCCNAVNQHLPHPLLPISVHPSTPTRARRPHLTSPISHRRHMRKSRPQSVVACYKS